MVAPMEPVLPPPLSAAAQKVALQEQQAQMAEEEIGAATRLYGLRLANRAPWETTETLKAQILEPVQQKWNTILGRKSTAPAKAPTLSIHGGEQAGYFSFNPQTGEFKQVAAAAQKRAAPISPANLALLHAALTQKRDAEKYLNIPGATAEQLAPYQKSFNEAEKVINDVMAQQEAPTAATQTQTASAPAPARAPQISGLGQPPAFQPGFYYAGSKEGEPAARAAFAQGQAPTVYDSRQAPLPPPVATQNPAPAPQFEPGSLGSQIQNLPLQAAPGEGGSNVPPPMTAPSGGGFNLTLPPPVAPAAPAFKTGDKVKQDGTTYEFDGQNWKATGGQSGEPSPEE